VHGKKGVTFIGKHWGASPPLEISSPLPMDRDKKVDPKGRRKRIKGTGREGMERRNE